MSTRNGYRLTEIGEIPIEWKVATLSDLVTRLENGLTYKQNSGGNGIPITRIETISDEKIDSGKVGLVEGLSDDEISRHRLEVGDILFSHINSVEHIGKTAIYRQEPPLLIHGMNLVLIRPKKGCVNPYFLLYYMKYGPTRNRFRSLAKNAVNQASINTTELKAFKVPVPPLVEQDEVATILATVDEAIERIDEIISTTQRLKKGLMQHLLTKGIGHTKFKQTEIGEIPENWKVTPIGSITQVRNGSTPRRNINEYWENGTIPWVPTTQVNERFITVAREYITDVAIRETHLPLVPRGSLLLAMIGQGLTRGKVAKLLIDATINQNFAAIYPCESLDSDFLFHYLAHNYLRIRNMGRGGNQWALNCDVVRSILIPEPPKDEQEKIAKILSSVDEKSETETERRQQLTQLKRGLMQDLLTGKVRVKVN
jgi:type I restriction enzyme S subunit